MVALKFFFTPPAPAAVRALDPAAAAERGREEVVLRLKREGEKAKRIIEIEARVETKK